jgi:hypothetical protein
MKKRPNYWANNSFYEMCCDKCGSVCSRSESESQVEKDMYTYIKQNNWKIQHPNRYLECNNCKND